MKLLTETTHWESVSFCCALTLSYRPCKHLTQLFCFDFCCSFRLTLRDTLMCVLSVCLLLIFCAAFAWERPNSNLQKHTVANCQGWSLYCYPLLCIKKPRFAFWCADTSVLLGMMPPAFLCIHPLSVQLTSVKSLHKWMLSSLHEMVLSLKKNTQHSKHMTAKQRLDVDVGVLETCLHGDKRLLLLLLFCFVFFNNNLHPSWHFVCFFAEFIYRF